MGCPMMGRSKEWVAFREITHCQSHGTVYSIYGMHHGFSHGVSNGMDCVA